MHFSSAGVAAAAAFSLIQLCPAPPAIAGAIAGGLISGTISGTIGAINSDMQSKRHFVPRETAGAIALPPGVTPETMQMCTDQINGQTIPIFVYPTGQYSARAENLPAACMELHRILLDHPVQAGRPLPIGVSNSSFEYRHLTADDKVALQKALFG